jgi:hypothetical protein
MVNQANASRERDGMMGDRCRLADRGSTEEGCRRGLSEPP